MNTLVQVGLIQKRKRHSWRTGYNISNEYTVPNYAKLKQGYFTVPRSLFSKSERSSDFKQACYHLMCKGNSNESFPSLSQIRKITKQAFDTILKGHKALANLLFLVKSNYIKRNGSYGHNRYSISAYTFDCKPKNYTQISYFAPLSKRVIVEPDLADFDFCV